MHINKGTNEVEVQRMKDFADWVLNIGDGNIERAVDGNVEDDITIPPEFCNIGNENCIDDMIDSTFPDFIQNYKNPKYLSERAILTPTNSTVSQNARIHAFIAPQILAKCEAYLKEGQIYNLSDFTVKYYIGDETSRSVRTDKHIYFKNDTKLIKDEEEVMKIEPQCFDFFYLEDVQNTKNDNRVPRKILYKKNDVEKSNVKFTLFDGRCYANVTFFNDFRDTFLKNLEDDLEQPVIIIIASAKITEWNDKSFYVLGFEDEEDRGIHCLTVKELFNLKEDYIEKRVQCKVTVKKIEKKVKWYTNYCAKCDIDIELVDKKYQCGKIYPYPDKRYQLTTLCSDSSETIPIIWNDEEVIRLCGKTVYDLIADDEEVEDGEKFPAVLKEFEKKDYNITITITNANVKEGSRVYTAAKISDQTEISGNHSPNDNNNIEVKPTEISMVSLYIF
ncbi:hypothetical protein POM88_014059 [Heracleum sosnowskyi]|uniref:ATP-dependent DNA helicase n=1 Tax=Heracleum sosnowskyi TaxID=360622 RepID=A0AAD8J104_9APIA|nr:hypothetical protein POM88_014059 [Heracleum sosnowskyi]